MWRLKIQYGGCLKVASSKILRICLDIYPKFAPKFLWELLPQFYPRFVLKCLTAVVLSSNSYVAYYWVLPAISSGILPWIPGGLLEFLLRFVQQFLPRLHPGFFLNWLPEFFSGFFRNFWELFRGFVPDSVGEFLQVFKGVSRKFLQRFSSDSFRWTQQNAPKVRLEISLCGFRENFPTVSSGTFARLL